MLIVAIVISLIKNDIKLEEIVKHIRTSTNVGYPVEIFKVNLLMNIRIKEVINKLPANINIKM